jgi:endonuclease/exonuclease/phosphatase family metal-dependent hydrolase
MKRRNFSAALAATALSACTRRQPPSPLRVRVLSFNLRYINDVDTGWRTWTARRDVVAELIRRDDADLIGVQEAFRAMLDDLAERVAGYEEIGVGREDGKSQGEYSALLVRRARFTVQESGTFWLSDTPAVPNSRTWGNTVTRICTWARLLDKPTGRTLRFFNTHFDHQSQPAREKGAALIIERLGPPDPATPLILTGDFNAGEDNPAIVALKNCPWKLVDSWRAAHPDVPASESGTLNMFDGRRDSPKIDYVFVPSGARVLDAAILHDSTNGTYPSDHFPVRATVEFPG